MYIFNRYINKVDYTWYDSSNIKHTACYDNGNQCHSLKTVFKDGKTYLYLNVSTEDYLMVKNAESTGKEFNRLIVKQYKGIRLNDTDLVKLEEFKNNLSNADNVVKDAMSDIVYLIETNKKTNEIRLIINGKVVYEGIENQVSLIDLFNSIGITYRVSEMETPCLTEQNFIEEDIV